ncbi:hypothetical protein MicloDRAFT_00037900 [Microvirga lotononidis]|uniref:Lipoprotein n=2 Tax=Microvirga lotononidis TaxID=864069 RepID=I4YTE0_9HYPH|nr:hypothetical protein MicloDRAFT_00037900 [Microvirga lotononidis]
MTDTALPALWRASLVALAAAPLAGCVSSSAAPGSAEAYGASMQATALAVGIASNVDPTGLSSVAGGMAYRAQQQARLAQTIGAAPMATDPEAELARARAYQRASPPDMISRADTPTE